MCNMEAHLQSAKCDIAPHLSIRTFKNTVLSFALEVMMVEVRDNKMGKLMIESYSDI